MGIRIVAVLAVVGGLALGIAVGGIAVQFLTNPGVDPWWRAYVDMDPVALGIITVAGRLGIVALAGATFGLVALYVDRLSPWTAAAGTIGVAAAAIQLLGAAQPLVVLLPLGSAIVVLDLARQGVLGRPLAITFLVSASAFAVLVADMFNGAAAPGAATALLIAYPVAWVLVGAALTTGISRASRVARGI